MALVKAQTALPGVPARPPLPSGKLSGLAVMGAPSGRPLLTWGAPRGAAPARMGRALGAALLPRVVLDERRGPPDGPVSPDTRLRKASR